MTLSRKLMGKGGGSHPSPYTTKTLTSAPNGGNNPWQVQGAYQRGGVVVFGWVDSSGNIECATYTEATDSVSSVYTIHASFQVDAHDSPAFRRRSSDGKILVVYCLHNGADINIRVSSNADDPSTWGSASNIDSQLGGTRYTDTQLLELSDGTLFLFYRDEPSAGTDSRWCYSTSSDGGTTWAAQTQLFKIASTRSYVVCWNAPGSDRIHFATTNGASAGFTKIGHFYQEGSSRYKSDGTSIGASLPLTFTDITTVYTGSGGVFPVNIVTDASGYPVVAGWDTMTYYYWRWNGSSWTSKALVNAGTGFEYNGAGSGYQPWGMGLDDGDPDVVWLLVDTGGNPDLWRYRTWDGGSNFLGVKVAATSGTVHTLVVVRNPSRMRAYYPVGSWTDYNNWNAGLVGAKNY